MSNRSELIAYRFAVQSLDEPLGAIERDCPSRIAARKIGQARAVLRDAHRLLGDALRDRVDGMADALDAQTEAKASEAAAS